ncbi:hypothetical protein [Treponema primitia]|uniref:hypothetical protein n=1 Tax=Treponema primitia TaxID=88058 RepID=UPI0002554E74|nr:hypothetical protein [Treponema primitia]
MYAEDWYVSNAGGMALEPAFSQYALRGKYALSVGSASPSELPEKLLQYYDPSYRIEIRNLYEEGVVSRRQWSFKDETELTRLAAVFEDDNSGFIELYNTDKLISESHQINADSSDYITYYYYNRTFLIRTETWLFTLFKAEPEDEPVEEEPDVKAEDPKETIPNVPVPSSTRAEEEGIEMVPIPRPVNIPVTVVKTLNDGIEEPIWTDYYRYTRSYALRSVERRYLKAPAEGQETAFFRFPQLILGVGAENEFVHPGSVFSSEFFDDVIINSGDRILYNTDERGRIRSEVRRDEFDRILGEVINTWSGDRLTSVLWKSDAEERLIEYEYNNDGDRIFERNLRNGVLERTVRQEGDREVEELYMNDAVVLRAVWLNGRKISEEHVRPGSDRRGE